MPRGRKQKRPVVEPIRRKCVGCGKVKLVVYREWFIPPVEKETFVSGADKKKSRLDIPGSSVKYFGCYPNDDGTFECGNA